MIPILAQAVVAQKPTIGSALLGIVIAVIQVLVSLGFAMLAVYAGIRIFDKFTKGIDEMAEFGRTTLDVLRQPLEDGLVVINRIGYAARMPCRFTLVGAMNPCVCGNLGRSDRPCACTPASSASAGVSAAV